MVEQFGGGQAGSADIKTNLYLLVISVASVLVGEEVTGCDDHEDDHGDGVENVTTAEQSEGSIAVVLAGSQA